MFSVYRPTWPLFAQAEIPQKRRTAEPGTAAWQVGISQAFAGQVTKVLPVSCNESMVDQVALPTKRSRKTW